MNHPFRAWLDTQEIDEASRALFEEGLLCYAAGAYRAALVFSYLGLLRTIAHRLMTSTKPVDIPEAVWAQIQSRIREDTTWENTALDSLRRQPPTSVFLIDDDLRTQIEYWRGRRNDAAHARTNEISSPHVESLWLFVRSSLPKFIVAGGRAGLFERFRRHFDPSFTPPGADFSHLVREIPQSIRPQEYQDFLRDLLQLTGDIAGSDDEEVDTFPELTQDSATLIRHIYALQDGNLRQALVDQLRIDQRLMIGAILDNPSLVIYYSKQGAMGSFVRKLWRDLLPLEHEMWFDPIDRSLRVVAFMLRNSLIPENEQREAVNRVLDKLCEGYPHSSYSDEVLNELAPFGFWEAVHRHAFTWSSVDWLAKNIVLAVEYLTRFPVDASMARSFAALVPEEPEEGDVYLQNTKFYEPEDAYNLANFYFPEHQDKLAELSRVAKEHGIDISHFIELMSSEESEDEGP